MPRTPTPEQAAAISYRDSACVLSSGAGCGKTTVLTARYLSLLTDDKLPVPAIAAMTFTERAAREMRKRIRDEVNAKIAGADEEGRAIWQTHKRHLESAPIQTIHAFCAALIRQHAGEAGIDPDAEVLDPAAAAVLRADAVRTTLETILTTDHALQNDLRALIVLFGWHATLAAVEGLLDDADEAKWRTVVARKPEALLRDWRATCRAIREPWLTYLANTHPGVLGCFATLDRITPPTPEARETFAAIRDGYEALKTTKDFPASRDELHERAKVARLGSKKQWPLADFETVKDSFEAFRKVLSDRFDVFTADTESGVTEAAVVGQQFLRVAAEANRAYRVGKARVPAIDFHDQIVGARDLLRDHDGVRKDLTDRFNAVLVDEFQDTDPTQTEFIKLLCGNENLPKKLFVVGDEKQSIYRFRGADVGLFRSLRAEVPDSGRLALTANYRSVPGVIGFVNALFSQRLDGYEPLRPTRKESRREADVEFLWSVPMPGAEPEKEPADAVRAREADAIARRIRALVEDESFRLSETAQHPARRVAFKDVVLLFRSMSHAPIYEDALRRHGIDYYLVGGLSFFAQQEVYDLLNLLKAIENPFDGPALVGLLRSPFCGLSDDALTLLAPHDGTIWDGLRDDARLATLPPADRPFAKRARANLESWREMKDRVPVAVLIETAVAATGYDAALQFESLADRKLANWWKLIEMARQYDRTRPGPAGFVAQLNELVTRQPREEQAATRPEEDDVVRLMTVHQAKGLEFPVVIVPGVSDKIQSGDRDAVRWHRELGCLVRPPFDLEESDDGWFSDWPQKLGAVADELADWQEELRVFYVACTRAEERLILSAGWVEPLVLESPTPIPKQGTNHRTTTLAERFDLRTGECLAEGHDVKVEVSICEPAEGEVTQERREVPPPMWLPRPPVLA
jgi:ATP-dependent helicase/nuclease subunit A